MAVSKPTHTAIGAVNRCTVDGCDRPHKARGYCMAHWMRWHRTGTAETVRQPGQHIGGLESADARLEDLQWMLDTGESPAMACHRLGVTPAALGRWLTRHGQPDLARIFYGLSKQQQVAAA